MQNEWSQSAKLGVETIPLHFPTFIPPGSSISDIDSLAIFATLVVLFKISNAMLSLPIRQGLNSKVLQELLSNIVGVLAKVQ